jgi:hypothetical protein
MPYLYVMGKMNTFHNETVVSDGSCLTLADCSVDRHIFTTHKIIAYLYPGFFFVECNVLRLSADHCVIENCAVRTHFRVAVYMDIRSKFSIVADYDIVVDQTEGTYIYAFS